MAGDKQQERLVKQEVNRAIQSGRQLDYISISGSRYPGLEKWARRKGIIFNPDQKVSVLA